MSRFKTRKIVATMSAIFFFAASLAMITPRVFAGDSGCQSGRLTYKYTYGGRPSEAEQRRQKRQFQAAQMRNSGSQPPSSGGNLSGGDSAARSVVSYLASLLVLFGGVFLLVSLLRERMRKNYAAPISRLGKIWNFAAEPSFALSTFSVLFVAAIVGSALTAPSATSAQAESKSASVDAHTPKAPAAMNNQSVFKMAQQIGGNGTTQIGAPVFDSSGNRYVRGAFSGTLTIGDTTLTATRDLDLFVAKYDADGKPVWARQGSGLTSAPLSDIAVEGATAMAIYENGPTQFLYVAGSFVKTLTLQGGANPSVTLSDDGAPGYNYESFIAKYDASGNLIWARGGDSGTPLKNTDNLEAGQNAIDQIVFDSNGNPYVAGFSSGVRFFGLPVVNNGESDILLAKLNPANGAVVWKQIIGGVKDDNGLDLKIDGMNNLYLFGNYGSPSITFPNGETFENPDDPTDMLEDSTDAFIAKFTAAGDMLWVEDLANDDTFGGSQIAVNQAGEIYLTGYYFDSATFGDTTLTETEGSGYGEDALGGYVAKLDTNGDFVWARGFGGVGKAIALDGAGRVYVVGTFWDGATFGEGTANAANLASFGGEDLFVARYDSNGALDWAKPIAGSGIEGQIAIADPTNNQGLTENNYNPLGIAYNPARQTMFISGDFSGVVSLDCLTLQTPDAASRRSYFAELSADNEAVSCRIWNGLDVDDNNWDSPDNWNGNILPNNGDSVYIPYTGNNFDNPIFNPTANVFLSNLTVADDRTLTLARDLNLSENLWLTGGIISANGSKVSLGAFAEALSISDGRVIGRVQKQFFGFGGAFTFPVGTENGYSPVTLSNINAGKGGSFAVTANQGAYPNTANNLPVYRANRWWSLTNSGLQSADITFKYLPGDITQGTESRYRAYRIPTGGGNASLVDSTINTTAKTVFVPNVTQFSDWTLAQPSAPTAASVNVGGRVIAGSRGIFNAVVTMTDQNGQTRTVRTNSFGYFRFAEVQAGETYIISVLDKRYTFTPRVVSLTDEIMDLIFAPEDY
jgi:hypothetical protein